MTTNPAQPTKTVTILKCDGEFRVPCPSGREEGAYYTTDREDALDTACRVWRHDPAFIHFKVRTVAEWPKYARA